MIEISLLIEEKQAETSMNVNKFTPLECQLAIAQLETMKMKFVLKLSQHQKTNSMYIPADKSDQPTRGKKR